MKRKIVEMLPTFEYAAFPAFAQFTSGISLRKNDKYFSYVSTVGRFTPKYSSLILSQTKQLPSKFKTKNKKRMVF